MARSTHTTWVLYAVIVVSALIIAGAIPVLLRARRTTHPDPVVRSPALQGRPPSRQPRRSGSTAERAAPGPTGSTTVKAYEQDSEWSGEAVDRIWLRGTVTLAGAIGIALIGVATATYLMAVRSDGASWACYVLAGLVTAGLPAIEYVHVRQLRRVHATQ
jgi:hypothetical protein